MSEDAVFQIGEWMFRGKSRCTVSPRRIVTRHLHEEALQRMQQRATPEAMRLRRATEAGVLRRAEHYYQQLDVLRLLRQEVRRDLLVESKKHKAWKLLRQIPGIGPIRAALLVALIQTPHRFRTKRQLWTYWSRVRNA